MTKHTLISLFSGAGGMDLGFKQSGFKILWANDFDEDATITYKNNIGNHIILGDIEKISSDDIPNNPDVIIGGFPCQGFSVANTKRNMCDKRNFLYKEMLRIIKDKKPKIFVAENVKGLLSMEKGKVITMAHTNVSDKFWKRKYDVDQAEICDYLKYWKDKSDYSVKQLDEHFGYKYTAGHWFRKDNKSGTIPSPEDWWELKKLLKFDDKYDKQVTTMEEKEIVYEQSLRITNWNRPSDTITATSPEIHVNKKT